MPGVSEHPVTLGDLFVETGSPAFPFLRNATVADLVSALRAEGVLVVEKKEGDWPEWEDWADWAAEVLDDDGGYCQIGRAHLNGLLHAQERLLDTLGNDTEAQPFPPAGGVS